MALTTLQVNILLKTLFNSLGAGGANPRGWAPTYDFAKRLKKTA